MRGELAEGVLPSVLRTLYVERRTGMLHVTRGGERASVCFIKGNLVYGDTNIKECQLGPTLVRHGLITEWDLERAGEMIQVTGRRLGQILVDLGCLPGDNLDEALALHVREVLLTIFSWKDGAYGFEDEDASRFQGYDRPLNISTGEVILDAVWSISDPDVIRYGLGDPDRVLAPASDPLLRFQRIALPPGDGFLLSRVDGVLTARQVLELAPMSREEAERSLFGLLYTGMVEYLPAAPAEKPASGHTLRKQVLDAYDALPRQDQYGVLGVRRDAAPAEVLAAYFRLARLFHPDNHHRPGMDDLKERLEALFGRVTEAHRVLSNPKARAAYDQSPAVVAPASGPPAEAPAAGLLVDPRQVDEILDRAEQALGARRYYETFALVEEVLPGASGRARRRARTLRADAHLRSGAQRAAEDELKAALDEDPANYEAHFLLGRIYKAGGAHSLAAGCFKRTLALRPRHAEALAELQSLPDEQKSRSGLRRFLRGS